MASSVDGVLPGSSRPWRGFGRPASGVRFRRGIGAGLAVVIGIGLVAWFAVGGPARQGITPGAGDCPAPAADPPAGRAGLGAHLVPVLPIPVGPVAATVCRYPEAAGGTARGAVLDAARTAEVAGWLDVGGGVAPAGTAQRCALDEAGAMVIIFGYAHGPDVRVTLSPHGCRAISNGVRTERYRPDVGARIDALVSAS